MTNKLVKIQLVYKILNGEELEIKYAMKTE